ncbi:MAG: DVU0298 family protein [Syntrophobacteraceae bacterium]
MPEKKSSFEIKKRVGSALAMPDFEDALGELEIPPERVISPLLSFLYDTNELTRWRAIRAVGIVVAGLGEAAPEAARNIMRRLIWSLNDESGGIGWGAPEAMGEIMARNKQLALEYYRILLSYIDPNGNPLEHDLLERGVLWGIGRLAQVRPELVRDSIDLLLEQCASGDAGKRALALWVLTFLEPEPDRVRRCVEPLLGEQFETLLYQDGSVVTRRTADMAARLLAG